LILLLATKRPHWCDDRKNTFIVAWAVPKKRCYAKAADEVYIGEGKETNPSCKRKLIQTN